MVICYWLSRGNDGSAGLFAEAENPYNKPFHGVIRACGHMLSSRCEYMTNLAFPQVNVKSVNATICYCTGDFCNGRSTSPDDPETPGGGRPGAGGSAAQNSVGHTAFGFIVTSLLVLAGARWFVSASIYDERHTSCLACRDVATSVTMTNICYLVSYVWHYRRGVHVKKTTLGLLSCLVTQGADFMRGTYIAYAAYFNDWCALARHFALNIIVKPIAFRWLFTDRV